MKFPDSVTVCEVGLRDGLQNEATVLSVEQKLSLLEDVQNAGVRLIEIGSLVNPKWVPQMAGTDEVYQRLDKREGVEYRVLSLNQKGLERAAAAGMKKVKIALSVSESHQRKNANCTPEEMLEIFEKMAVYASENGIVLSGALATAFGCPFEGAVSTEKIKAIVKKFRSIGVSELSLSDTTGMANPLQVYRLCSEMLDAFPDIMWNLHFHNTRGMGLANVLAGLQAGVERFDASLGGLGGCPFAPGASGNISTEDLVHMFDEMGIKTGIDVDKMLAAARKLAGYVGHELSGAILKAGKTSDLHEFKV